MDYEKIGKFIQERRKELSLTQEDLAKKLSITDRAVSKWERGKGCPDISILEKLASILKVSVLELLHGEKVKNQDKAIVDMVKQSKKKINVINILFLVVLNTVMVILIYQNLYYFFYTRLVMSTNDTMIVDSTNMINVIYPKDVIKYNKKYNFDNITIGDIIVKKGSLGNYEITRVKQLKRDEHNQLYMVTKGDFNNFVDNEVLYKIDYVGKVVRVYSSLADKYYSTDGKMPVIIFLLYTTGIVSIIVIDICQYNRRRIFII